MPRRRIWFEGTPPKLLEISWQKNAQVADHDVVLSYDHQVFQTVPAPYELRVGMSLNENALITLPNGRELALWLRNGRLHVALDGCSLINPYQRSALDDVKSANASVLLLGLFTCVWVIILFVLSRLGNATPSQPSPFTTWPGQVLLLAYGIGFIGLGLWARRGSKKALVCAIVLLAFALLMIWWVLARDFVGASLLSLMIGLWAYQIYSEGIMRIPFIPSGVSVR